MKTSSPTTKNKTNKKNTKTDDYNNSQEKKIYINSSDVEVSIGYDVSMEARYIQISNIK